MMNGVGVMIAEVCVIVARVVVVVRVLTILVGTNIVLSQRPNAS